MNRSVARIPTDNPRVYAFRISGEVQAEDMHDLARTMNEAFDQQDSVDMLLLFEPYDGAETGATMDWESIKTRFRSLSHVEKYAVVGVPDRVENLIAFMDKLIPVTAETFEAHEVSDAWSFVNARPVEDEPSRLHG